MPLSSAFSVTAFIAALAFSNLASAQPAQSAVECAQNSQNMSELRACADASLSSGDERLDSVIREIERLYKDKPEFLAAFRNAQLAWEKFYAAQMRMMFPHMDTPSSYGSVFGYCFNDEGARLITARINQLQQWVDGREEGDVCSGSIRNSDPPAAITPDANDIDRPDFEEDLDSDSTPDDMEDE